MWEPLQMISGFEGKGPSSVAFTVAALPLRVPLNVVMPIAVKVAEKCP